MSEATNERVCIQGLWAVYAAVFGWSYGPESKPDAVVRSVKAPDSHRHVLEVGDVAVEHTLFPMLAQQKAIEAQFREIRQRLPREQPGLGFIHVLVQLTKPRLPRGLDEDLLAFAESDIWPPEQDPSMHTLANTGLQVEAWRDPDGHDRVVWRTSSDADNAAERIFAVMEETEEKFADYANARRVLLIETDDWVNVGSDTFPRLLVQAGIDRALDIEDIWTVETGIPEELHYRVLHTEDPSLKELWYVAWTPETSDLKVRYPS